jgi:hypothetical protein
MKTKTIYVLFIVLLSSTGAIAQQLVERLEIQKNDSVILTTTTHIKELIINADKNSSGQLMVSSGIVQVDRIVLKFTFIPAEWTVIAFPVAISDLRNPSVSNFAQLGFNFGSGSKRFQMRRYDPAMRAQDKDPWVTAIDASVPSNSGVMLQVTTGSTTPQEIEFYFDNTTLSASKQENELLIDLDMQDKALQQTYQVRIEPVNAAGQPLEIQVVNAPQMAPAPLNYAEELAAANIYFNEDKSAIRIALPTSEPAKVLVMDRRMKKILNAYEYVSPAALSVEHLRKGRYHLFIEYGNASEVKSIKL